MFNRKNKSAEQLILAFDAAIIAGNPRKVLIKKIPFLFPKKLKPTFVLAIGKAASSMAEAIKTLNITVPGIIITNDENFRKIEGFDCIASGHPNPDIRGLNASKKVIKIISKLNRKDHLLLLLSGGGSALLPYPSKGISLKEKNIINQRLLEKGINIHKVNAVRRLFSRLKGGRLAKLAEPAKITQLVFSDVPGDNLETIASGLAAPDPVLLDDTLKILRETNLLKIPFVSNYIKKIQNNLISEPIRENDTVFNNVETYILASNSLCIDASSNYLSSNLNQINSKPPPLEGEASEMGIILAEWLIKNVSEESCYTISGGETTVTLNPNNKSIGGRSQELAISFSLTMHKNCNLFHRKWAILAAGTDGRDGPTDAAGAIIASEDSFDITHAEQALKVNESYKFLSDSNLLFKTNGTDTNLGDLVIIIIK